MDIQYLLFLQNLREILPDFVTEFLYIITQLGGGVGLAVIPVIIYYCFDRRKGLSMCLCFTACSALNSFLKNTFCINRPWIRSEAITPDVKALPGATGYSFPSGHTACTGSIIGMIAWQYRARKAVAALCVVFILLVGFSRNYLGCHTPQDVLVGLIEAIVMIAIFARFTDWLETHEDKYGLVFIIGLVIWICYVLYINLKGYPEILSDEGTLLVDPADMIYAANHDSGFLIGVLTGWFLERRFIHFDTDNLTVKDRIIRVVIGFGLAGIVFGLGSIVFKAVLPYTIIPVIKYGLTLFTLMFLAPLCFTSIEKRKKS